MTPFCNFSSYIETFIDIENNMCSFCISHPPCNKENKERLKESSLHKDINECLCELA